jgi:hypothetical protein
METVFFFFQVKQQKNRMRLKQRIKVSFFLNKRVSKVNFKIFLLIVKKKGLPFFWIKNTMKAEKRDERMRNNKSSLRIKEKESSSDETR